VPPIELGLDLEPESRRVSKCTTVPEDRLPTYSLDESGVKMIVYR
jgi:hypothetical protein